MHWALCQIWYVAVVFVFCDKLNCWFVDEDITKMEQPSNRDCRGLCVQPVSDMSETMPIPSQTYTLDQCGICRLSLSPTFNQNPDSITPQDSSQSVDCNGNCQLPGLSKLSVVCGQCVRQNDLSNVKDECGNCLSEGHPCSCDR